MSTLSSANVTDVNLVLKERTHMRLCTQSNGKESCPSYLEFRTVTLLISDDESGYFELLTFIINLLSTFYCSYKALFIIHSFYLFYYYPFLFSVFPLVTLFLS